MRTGYWYYGDLKKNRLTEFQKVPSSVFFFFNIETRYSRISYTCNNTFIVFLCSTSNEIKTLKKAFKTYQHRMHSRKIEFKSMRLGIFFFRLFKVERKSFNIFMGCHSGSFCSYSYFCQPALFFQYYFLFVQKSKKKLKLQNTTLEILIVF